MGNEEFRQAFRPLLPGVTALDFNNFYDLNKIDGTFACVIAEPLQAEAGVVVPAPGFLPALRKRCTDTGTLLIFDEVQTGFGRLGTLFAMEKYGVVPDIVTLAKALGGGMPLGALACKPELMSAWQNNPVLGHITTFGGHPVCCAAGLASLKVLLQESWIEHAGEKASYVRQVIGAHPRVIEIRGEGLLLAVELGSADLLQQMISLLLDEGVLSDWFLYCDTAFRISPPLCISMQELEYTCRKVLNALDRLK